MTQWVEVVPAYGRDYTSQKQIQADWDANKDFKITTGGYVNKSDAQRFGLKVIVRYAQLRKVYGVK